MKKKTSLSGILLGILISSFFAAKVYGISFTENFSDTTYLDSSTLVWNFQKGELHPPLKIKDYIHTLTPDDKNFKVGDGRHGAFIESRYEEFSEGEDLSDSIIRINTDTYPALYVSEFVLKSGWTIEPRGSHPLKIYSLSDILIKGTILCSGKEGEDIEAPNTSTPQGGEGRCGGGAGGAGAVGGGSPRAAEDGESGGEVIEGAALGGGDGPTPGSGAALAGTGLGGGGGGAYQGHSIGFDAVDGPGGGGSAGEMGEDHDFSVEGSGHGGGGGDYSANSAGGGGGGGGGSIYMYAVGNIDVYPGGEVLARGGQGGGGSSGTLTAGGGGGGGGGSILMFAGGDVRLAGTVSAEHGDGGSDAGGAGGQGADGRTWLAGSSADGLSTSLESYPFVIEAPECQMSEVGKVRYRTDEIFEAISNSIDTLNTKPTLEAVSIRGNSISGVKVEWASGSTENFEATHWKELEEDSWTADRFLKFRVQIENTGETDPSTLTRLQLNYSPFQINEFEFKGGCGRISGVPWNSGMLILFLPLLLALFLKMKSPRLGPEEDGSSDDL